MAIIKDKLLAGSYDKSFSYLYNDIDEARSRYARLVDGYVKYFDSEPTRLFSAPGRTEVGGNHTDHQHGCVITGSIDLDVIAAVCENNENVVRIRSEGYGVEVIDLSNLEPQASEVGRSAALIRGVCSQFVKRGLSVKGFNAFTTSNVLKGSGLSSSAAFEVLIANIINNMFNNGALDPVTLAKISQYAENVYFGKPCGLLDQMACSVGGFTAVDFKSSENPVVEKVEFNLSERDFSLVIVNTGGNHADLTDDYAAITKDCFAVSNFFGKKVLRDVNREEFYSKLSEVRKATNDRAILRAIHFFNENDRAILQKKLLMEGNFEEFLKVVRLSGESSFKYLQNVYSPSLPTEQGISLALALGEQILGSKGVCRVHGGGFAGTIQAFVPNDMLTDLVAKFSAVFGENSCYILSIRQVGGYELVSD